ncbi:unnamed protein product [Trypanosoma congolense IL3000]|uniref:WGS project CAEQ00000000 data, annotated contig 1541 n=1 Tax=Trypanosoma congolense (strain IL3000) TaxID=1068625 RepID=F9W6Z8_TRYCI|nr:unnamed protein product [Trypanosoma congolense IL3000]
MGGIPSRDAPTTLFCLRYGTHEVGLIPLVYRYFHSDNKELREQFIRVRNDPSIRYSFMRSSEYAMDEIPKKSYSEKHLDRFLDVVDESLYDSTSAMLADEDTPFRPVPCAVCFVYVNGREGSDCFSFYGRRINIIGHFGCYDSEDHASEGTCLYARKTILKAAGDRTLERVVTLSAMMLKVEFFRAVQTACPTRDPLDMLRRRLKPLTLIASTPWNSYPTLKFLYDTAVIAWAYGREIVEEDPPQLSMYEVEASGESGLCMRVRGPVLLWAVMRVCETLSLSAVRGSWEQYVLDDFEMQQKEKIVSHWLATSPHVHHFLGSEEFTALVQRRLATLLREVVRARETPTEDVTLWGEAQEYSHDGKLYRIFNSPTCGPFLATVKRKLPKRGGSGGNTGSTNSGLGSEAPIERRTDPVANIDLTVGLLDDAKRRSFLTSAYRPKSAGTSPATFPPHVSGKPPQYRDAINSVLHSQLASAAQRVVYPVVQQATNAPPVQQTASPQMSSAFVPMFQQTTQPPVQPLNVPYVVLAPPSQLEPQPEVMFPGTVANYVMLPDGRIGLINAPMAPSMGFWSQ